MDNGRCNASCSSVPSYWCLFLMLKDIPREEIRTLYPDIDAKVEYSTPRGMLYFTASFFAIIADCRPSVDLLTYEGDSMGGSTLNMELRANGMRLSMSWDYSLSDSWQSVEQNSYRCEIQGHPFTFLQLDVNINGSGTAQVSIDNADASLIAKVETLGAVFFEQYRKSWAGDASATDALMSSGGFYIPKNAASA